ncbi:MAG: amino acid permease [Leptospirillum sp.]
MKPIRIKGLFLTHRHPDHVLRESTSDHHRLKPSLGRWDLVLLGIGGVIGVGVFVLTGIAAAVNAGPSVAISFLLGAVIATMAAFIYAEFASSVPVTGSAYLYVSLAFGEIPAFVTGWTLILTYGVGAMAVAIGWASYVDSFLRGLSIPWLPPSLTRNPFDGGILNLPAGLILLFILSILMLGTRNSASFNNLMVFVKLGIIALFLILGSRHINPANWHPFFLHGASGVIAGTMTIFFAYVGFDAITTAAEEAKNPKKDIPFGIIFALVASSILYILVSIVLTGMEPSSKLNNAAPVANALLENGIRFGETLISGGALVGLTSVLLVLLFAQSRILVIMARDGLMPPWMARVHPKRRTPVRTLSVMMVLVVIPAMIFPIHAIAKLTSSGTILSFIFVSLALLRFRKIHPDRDVPFKCPCFPWLPIGSIAMDLILLASGSGKTLFLLLGWLFLGLVFHGARRLAGSPGMAHHEPDLMKKTLEEGSPIE